MRGTNAFALKMKENYKNHLKGIESVKEDEEEYDPYKPKINLGDNEMFAGLLEK